MFNKGSPQHPGSSGGGGGGGDGDPNDFSDEMMYEEIVGDFDDDDDLIEVIDDDEDNDATDVGNLADDEEDEDDYTGPGIEGFEGQKPDHVLTSHLENAVFCCSFNANGQCLLTGGEDDIANVWNCAMLNMESPVFKCRGHKDSVVSVSFNWDSSYFATCDLSGIIKVWKSANQENVISFETGDFSWSFWHTASNVLFAGCEDGSIYMWKIPSGDCKIYAGSTTKCECGVLLPDGKRLLAGYADGTLKLFDLKSGEIQFNFSKSLTLPSPILCVAAHPTRQVIACGSANGTVALFSTQNGKLLTTLDVCSSQDDGAPSESVEHDSVEGIAFSSDPNLDFLVCGSVQGDVIVWDLATMTQRVKIHQDAGLSKILWHPIVPLIYTAGLDGVIRVIDARTCKVESLLGRHRTEILDICISKDGSMLASASEDGTVFVFALSQS